MLIGGMVQYHVKEQPHIAGVHCLDLAADVAVVAAARRGIAWACARGNLAA